MNGVQTEARVAPGLHDGFTLNVVHEVDSIDGGLTLVSAGLGIAFSTPSVQTLWPEIVFRPLAGSAYVEQAVGYRRDVQSPVLDTFLRVVRQVVRKKSTRS